MLKIRLFGTDDLGDQGRSMLGGHITDQGDTQQLDFELKLDNSVDFNMEDESAINPDDILTDRQKELLDCIVSRSSAERQSNGTTDLIKDDGIKLQLSSDVDVITTTTPSAQEYCSVEQCGSDNINVVQMPDVLPIEPSSQGNALMHPESVLVPEKRGTDNEIPVVSPRGVEISEKAVDNEIPVVSPRGVEISEKAPDDTENISLEDIMRVHKQDDDSSGSEFDFELPSVSKSSKPQSPDMKQQAPVPPSHPVTTPPQVNRAPSASVTTPPHTDLTPSETLTTPPQVNHTSSEAVVTSPQKEGADANNFTSGKFPVSFIQSSLTANISLVTKSPEKKLSEEVIDTPDIQPQEESVSETTQDQSEPLQEDVPRSHTRAQNEWDHVQTIEAGFADASQFAKGPSGAKMSPLIAYSELEEGLQQFDYSSVKPNIHLTMNRRGFSAFKHMLFGPPKLNRNLLPEKEFIFCLAASPLDNSTDIHTKALQTVYRCLTGSRFDCSRFGSHWEEVGFQGNDPSTDLRGTGLLGILNLVHMLRNPKRQTLAQDVYKLSLHPTQNFPFCVMGINISRIVIQALREDCLNKDCNRRQEVLSVVNDLYTALYLELYQTWKSQGKTITDSGNVIKALEFAGKKNPSRLIKNMEDYLERKKSACNLDNMDIGGENFLSVCDTEAGQY